MKKYLLDKAKLIFSAIVVILSLCIFMIPLFYFEEEIGDFIGDDNDWFVSLIKVVAFGLALFVGSWVQGLFGKKK